LVAKLDELKLFMKRFVVPWDLFADNPGRNYGTEVDGNLLALYAAYHTLPNAALCLEADVA